MTRALLFPSLLVAALLLLIVACGGDGKEPARGSLTDPNSVPTATPWSDPPDPIILDPDALTPISGGEGEGEGENGEGDGTPTASGECGETYVVESGDVPFTIAEKCGVSVEDLLSANEIDDPTGLRVGQELTIP